MGYLFFQNYYTPYRDAFFEALSSAGCDVAVAYLHFPEDEGRLWGAVTTAKTYASFQCRRSILFRHVLSWLPRAAWSGIRGRKIILLDNTPTNLSMIIYAVIFRFLRLKIYVWVEHTPGKLSGKAVLLYERICSNALIFLSDGVISLSAKTREYLSQRSVRRPIIDLPQVVPVPVGRGILRRSAFRNEGRKVFGFMGSTDARKNLSSLLEAFDLYSRECSDFELLVAGGASGEDFGDHPGVIFLGYLDGDARERFFASIDFLILPSLHDPWGLVCNEALLRGVFPICTSGCGAAELTAKIDRNFVTGSSSIDLLATLRFCAGLSNDDFLRLTNAMASVGDEYSISRAVTLLCDSLQ